MDLKIPGYIKLFIGLLSVVLVATVMMEAKMLLVPILVALLLSVLISPFTSWLDRVGIPSLLSVFISVIALLGFLFGLGTFFYNQLLGFSGDLTLLEHRFGELLGFVNEFLEEHIDGSVPISFDSIQSAIFKYLYENMAMLTDGMIATVSTITLAFMVPIYIIFMLYYRRFLLEFTLQAFGSGNRQKTSKIVHNVKNVVQNYIVGMFIVMCILAVLNTIALHAIGIKHALLFAVIAAILNIIPFLGPFLGSTLPILYAFLTMDSLWYPIAVFLSFYVIQLFESNLFVPKIVGGKVSMNPLMTLITLFVGNYIWGFMGMILFIPGIAILKVVLDEIKGMEPYAYLLGDIRKTTGERSENFFERQFKKMRKKLNI